MNIIIDDLPYEYEGYLINYNFRTGILISECLIDGEFEDNEDGEEERIWTSLRILYGKGVPPTDIALKGLSWFLNCGDVQCNKEQEVSELLFSFFEDRNRISNRKYRQYAFGIDFIPSDDRGHREQFAEVTDKLFDNFDSIELADGSIVYTFDRAINIVGDVLEFDVIFKLYKHYEPKEEPVQERLEMSVI